MQKLQKNTIYKNTWNIFSRSFLLKENFDNNNANLVIVDNEKQARNYQKILEFLGVEIKILDNVADLVNIFFNKTGNYIALKNIFEKHNLDNFYELENYFSLKFENNPPLTPPSNQGGEELTHPLAPSLNSNRGEIMEKEKKLTLEEILKKLNDFWYKNSDFIENFKFYKSGDILSIWNNNKEYKISFWGDDVERIDVFSTSPLTPLLQERGIKEKNISSSPVGEDWGEVSKVYFWENRKINFSDEIKPELNQELLEKINESEINIFLLNIDFYEFFEEITEKLDFAIVFSDTYNSFSLGGKDVWKTDRGFKNLDIKDIYIENLEKFTEILKTSPQPSPLGGEGVAPEKKVIIYTKNKKTIKNFLDYNNIVWIEIIETNLNNLKSFTSPLAPLLWEERGIKEKKNISSSPIGEDWGEVIVICDDNISRIFIKKRLKKSIAKELDLLMQIKAWDYVVHLNHWVWIFKGIIEKDFAWIKKEYIEIEYAKEDKLFVPIVEISRVNKYVWVENPKLTWLWWVEWTKKINKAKQEVLAMASEILEIYAKRKLVKGFAFKDYREEQIKFQQSFEYNYTPDQIKVIEEIWEEMSQENPMDKLLTWDVWFWKTEVAFNAIYKAILNGKQTALVTPLVVLAYEHFEKAKERFANFPINIEVLTRFESNSKAKEILKKLEEGKIDLIIWTHRILNENINFKDLWLIVVDEEHKFWVQHKEKLKEFRAHIDILSMSATPIPRSLNMALNGLKSISMLTTPPASRKSIETFVTKYDEKIILEAWKKEFERWWQLFFIHNRVATIESMKVKLEKIFKWKKVIIVHGQLHWDDLERRILAFKRKQYDILLATTVIENGIDFPNVNTIIINDAYRFGISQIHQLRWRVGRAEKQAYCYLLFRKEKLNEIAAKRLKTIVEYTHLGSGFELALKDLEIRWAGDILGLKQSGQVTEIWLNLFLTMLEEKVEEMKKTKKITNSKNQPSPLAPLPWGEKGITSEEKIIPAIIDLNIWAFILDDFFASSLDKINFYREIETLNSLEDLNDIIKDFKELNNDFPQETNNLFLLLKLRLKAGKYNISLIKKVGINYQIEFWKSLSPESSLPDVEKGATKKNKEKEIKILKKFLDLDKKVNFTVLDIKTLRSPVKKYSWDLAFLNYLDEILSGRKVKIRKKIVKKK